MVAMPQVKKVGIDQMDQLFRRQVHGLCQDNRYGNCSGIHGQDVLETERKELAVWQHFIYRMNGCRSGVRVHGFTSMGIIKNE